MTPTLEARLLAKLDRSAGLDGCWPFTAARDGNGYGMIGVRKSRHARAHRAAYSLWVGPIPAGQVVMHTCDNPPCCNPRHLLVGSKRENNADRAAKSRSADTHGEKHPRAVLTDELVREIRRLHAAGWQYREIAVHIGHNRHAVYDVLRGRTWRHVA